VVLAPVVLAGSSCCSATTSGEREREREKGGCGGDASGGEAAPGTSGGLPRRWCVGSERGSAGMGRMDRFFFVWVEGFFEKKLRELWTAG